MDNQLIGFFFFSTGDLSNNNTNPSPYALRVVMLPYFNKQKCQKIYEESHDPPVTRRMLCAGYVGQNKGILRLRLNTILV